MRSIELTDPRGDSTSQHALDSFIIRLIHDPRDKSFVYLALSITFVLVPAAMVLYVPGVFRWWIGTIYLFVNFGLFFDRYILMLHNTSHRPLFRRSYRLLNHYIPTLLGPIFGQSPWTYYAHHIGMHHPENNLSEDRSSTLAYQRDSIRDFVHYWLSFFFLGLVDLCRYLRRKDRRKLYRRAFFGELSFLVAVGVLCCLNWRATLMVFIAPFVMARFLMMAGNWSQHAFIDPQHPDTACGNSIVCINCRYNRRCFNDGYHIGHHEKATRHWSEMPKDFEQSMQRYASENAVVFEGIDYFGIWWLLMRKQYDRLASYFVDLHDRPRSHAEIVALLRTRTQAIQTK